MGKKIINIFLVLVLSVQMLPVQQMGRMLFSNQFNEEIPHSVDAAKSIMKKADSDFVTPPVVCIQASIIYLHKLQPAEADAIPLNYATDILVPPPNYCG
ncbi:hypothetical protein [Asinibacterium sp. OR53]|uniref:hypothetical protein n=1 Tax=Asinibacterium sp. OR53 TaxID=925409 RepID=UPI000479C6B0|nr:hypothetical protein [Asinibacterium sp. OR53]